MKVKLVNKNINNLLKPKTEEDIIKKLDKLTQEEKNEKLIEASKEGLIIIIKLLLKYGINVNTKDEYGYTPLIYASKYGNKEAVNILLNFGADINTKNNYGNTALIWALRNNYNDIVKLLKRYGAKN